MADRARKSAPQAQLVTIGNFLADPALDELYIQLTGKEKTAVVSATRKTVAETADRQTENTITAVKNEDVKENPSDNAAVFEKKQVLVKEGIRLGQAPVSKEEAIQAAG